MAWRERSENILRRLSEHQDRKALKADIKLLVKEYTEWMDTEQNKQMKTTVIEDEDATLPESVAMCIEDKRAAISVCKRIRRDLQRLLSEGQRLMDENADLRSKLKDVEILQEKNTQLVQLQKKLEEDLAELKEDRKKMQTEMMQRTIDNAEKLDHLIKANQELEVECETLRNGNRVLNKNTQSLEKEHADLCRKLADREVLQNENTQLRQQQQKLEKDLEELKKDRKKRQRETAELKIEKAQLLDELDRHIADKGELEKHRATIVRENQELRQSMKNLADVNSELLHKTRMLEQHQKELCTDLRDVEDEWRENLMEVAQLKKDNARLSDKLDHHTKEERESDIIREELLNEIQTLSHKTQTLEIQNVELSRKQDDFVSVEATQVEQQLKELEKGRNELWEDNMQMQFEMIQLKQRNAKLSDELEHHIEAKQESEEIREELLSEIQMLCEKTRSMEHENDDLRKKCDLLQNDKTKVKQGRTEQENDLDKLGEDSQKRQIEMTKLIEENAQLSTQQEHLIADKRELEKRYESLLSERESFVNQNSEMQRIQHDMLEDALQANERLTKENEELVEKIASILELTKSPEGNSYLNTNVNGDVGCERAAGFSAEKDDCNSDNDDISSDFEYSISDLSSETEDDQTENTNSQIETQK